MICCKLWHFSDHLYWYIRQHKGPGSQAQELQQTHVSAYKENYWNNLVIYCKNICFKNISKDMILNSDFSPNVNRS